MGNRVQRVKTEVNEPQIVQALSQAWQELFHAIPTKEQMALLLAQNSLETGNRKAMWNYNIGNITTDGKGKYDYFDDLTTSEQIKPGVWRKMRLKYRAYPSLKEGVKDYLNFLSKGRYAESFKHILNPDPVSFSKSLKEKGYYTEDEQKYTKQIVSHYNNIIKSPVYQKALSNQPSSGMLASKTEDDGVWEKINSILNKYLQALANINHPFLIKINGNNITNSIEYSRILSEALEENYGLNTSIHSDGENVEVFCKIKGNPYFCKEAIYSLNNQILNIFNKNSNVNIKTDILNKKSELNLANIDLITESYENFHINFKRG